MDLIVEAFNGNNDLAIKLAKRLKSRIDEEIFFNQRLQDEEAFYVHLLVIKRQSLKGRIKFIFTVFKRLFMDKLK